MASQTEQALLLEAQSVSKLLDIFNGLLSKQKTTEADRDAAKQQALDLTTADATNAAAATDLTNKINTFIDSVAAATPGTPTPTSGSTTTGS